MKKKIGKLEWCLAGFSEILFIMGIIFWGKAFELIVSTQESFLIIGFMFILLAIIFKYGFEFVKMSIQK